MRQLQALSANEVSFVACIYDLRKAYQQLGAPVSNGTSDGGISRRVRRTLVPSLAPEQRQQERAARQTLTDDRDVPWPAEKKKRKKRCDHWVDREHGSLAPGISCTHLNSVKRGHNAAALQMREMSRVVSDRLRFLGFQLCVQRLAEIDLS